MRQADVPSAKSPIYDVVVVGGGPAGLTAALYAARRASSVLVLSEDIGGQAAATADVENYPGFEHIDGLELMEKFRRQAERYGATVRLEEVQGIERQGDDFSITTSRRAYGAHAVILAFGLTHKHLDVPGEKALIGKGVVYCTTCDAPLFSGQKVVVVGGGNSAMDAALYLAKICPQVDVLTKNAELRGERVLIERVQGSKAITVHYQASVSSVLGADRVTGIRFTDADGRERNLEAGGVFVEIGYTVQTDLVRGLLELDDRNQIVISPQNATSVPGIFAAGDITTISQKQIVIAAGEGAKAALAAVLYLQSRGHVSQASNIDWGSKTLKRHEAPVSG